MVRLEVWPGYITAIRRYEGGLLLLTDVKHRVLRTETVLDIMYVLRMSSLNCCGIIYLYCFYAVMMV